MLAVFLLIGALLTAPLGCILAGRSNLRAGDTSLDGPYYGLAFALSMPTLTYLLLIHPGKNGGGEMAAYILILLILSLLLNIGILGFAAIRIRHGAAMALAGTALFSLLYSTLILLGLLAGGGGPG